PGLRLAVADAARGVLTPVQMHRVQDSMMSLIEDLDDHDDDLPAPAAEQDDTNALFRREASPPPRDPPPGIAPPPEERPERWRSQTPVLCIAGRGPMDEVAAAMLVQLLRKHGLGADVLPQAVATRTGIVALNPTGVAMICVCSVEVRGTPSHLRFALRRLRQRAPEAMLLAGLWTPDDPVPRDDARRATLGADLCAVTLTEAVEACLAAASGEMDDSGGAEQAPIRRAGTTVARSAS
ncbi:MAG: AI-2E family transporter, partial [Acetobacteraceae bacterium]